MSAVAITLTTTQREPTALFLQSGLGTATMPDGRKVAFGMSGASLVLEVSPADDKATPRNIQTLSLSDIAEAWMRAIDEAGTQ